MSELDNLQNADGTEEKKETVQPTFVVAKSNLREKNHIFF